MSIVTRRSVMEKPARSIVLSVVLLTAIAIAAGICWNAYALSKTQHKQQKLQALSRTFAEQLEVKRPQLYCDLLRSEEPAQKKLNEDPNIQLSLSGNATLGCTQKEDRECRAFLGAANTATLVKSLVLRHRSTISHTSLVLRIRVKRPHQCHE